MPKSSQILAMDAETNEETNNPRTVCMDTILSMISKVESRFRAADRTMVLDNISPLERTPLSSNCSRTPDQASTNKQSSRKSFDFEGLEEAVGARKVSSRKYASAGPTMAVEYKNLPRRSDVANLMESLFKKGYDSDGEVAPYTTINQMELEELEKVCDISVGRDATAGVVNNLPVSSTPASPNVGGNNTDEEDNVFIIQEQQLKKLKRSHYRSDDSVRPITTELRGVEGNPNAGCSSLV